MHLTHYPAPVDDGLLAQLSTRGHLAAQGDLTPETRDFLDHTMPGLCAELLSWRETVRNHPAELAMLLRSLTLEDQLEEARRTILCADACTPEEIAQACDRIQRLSPLPHERDAAADVLAEIYGESA